MTRKQVNALLIGGGVLAAAGLAYYFYTRSQALPPGPVPGQVFTITLAPGTMTPVQLSLANKDAISLVAPTGATLGNVTFSQTGILGAPASGANYEYVAIAAGTTTLTATYTDTSGATQTATFTVTVQ